MLRLFLSNRLSFHISEDLLIIFSIIGYSKTVLIFMDFFYHFIILRVLISENGDLLLIICGIQNFEVYLERA